MTKYVLSLLLDELLEYMAICFKKDYNKEKAQLESLKKIQSNYDMSFEEELQQRIDKRLIEDGKT